MPKNSFCKGFNWSSFKFLIFYQTITKLYNLNYYKIVILIIFAVDFTSKILSLISKIKNMYPEEMVKPMRAELSDAGFQRFI